MIKKCKGKGKAKGLGCGIKKDIEQFHYGLCDVCYPKFLTETEEGNKIIQEISKRSHNKTIRDEKAELRKKKEELKTIKDYKKELQPIINSIIRFIDWDKGCISCNHGWEDKWTRQRQAGHYFDKKSNDSLRFNVFNIWTQCTICNDRLSANIDNYRKGIIKHYGSDMMSYIDFLPSEYGNISFDIESLRTAIKTALEIKNNILKGKNYSRLEVSNLIGLYN